MLPILFTKSWEGHLANLPSLINQIIRGHLCRYPLYRTWGTGMRSIESFPLFRYVDRWLWWEAKTLIWFPYNEPGTIAVDCPLCAILPCSLISNYSPRTWTFPNGARTSMLAFWIWGLLCMNFLSRVCSKSLSLRHIEACGPKRQPEIGRCCL